MVYFPHLRRQRLRHDGSHLRSTIDERLAGLPTKVTGGWRVVAEEEVYDTLLFLAENDIS